MLAGFADLPLHPDVVPGVRALHDAGYRLAAMTNGSAAVTERILTRAGIREYFEAVCDVAGPRCWKPSPRAYHYAAEHAGTGADAAALVAVHPWDVDGAHRAGLAGIWLRRGTPLSAYPRSMTPPALSADDLTDLAEQISAS